MTVNATVDGEVGEAIDLGLLNAGAYEVPFSDLVTDGLTDRSRFEVVIEARSPHGDARARLVGVPERR
jgi:hypothetical protein